MQVESGLTIKYPGRVPPLDLSNVNVCLNHHQTTENDFKWKKIHPILPKKINSTLNHNRHHHINNLNTTNICHHNNNNNQDLKQIGSDGLPIDPRDWTRADVWKWLINMAVSEGLDANPDLAQKFPMNGKALCLMSLDMYLSRVPIGGKMLYRDFRVRLARAMSL